jgi:hypothetical protein
VPVLYSLFEDLQTVLRRAWRGSQATSPSSANG